MGVMVNQSDITPHAGAEMDDSQIVYEATRMIRLGAAAFVQTVTDGGPYYLYGPGFQVEITHTDPAADYPGSVNNMKQQDNDG